MEATFSLPAQHRIERLLASEDHLPRALARDLNSNTVSVAIVTAGAHASRLLTRKGLRHRHLATLSSAVEATDASTFLAEYVPGRTLTEARLAGPIDPFKALIWFTRLLEALAALHEEPAVHGALSPLAIIVEPEQRAIAPVLTQLAVPAIGAYCSPEQLQGEAPCAADDSWSLLASLYFAIAGKAPFGSDDSAKIRERIQSRQLAPLSEFGVDDPEFDRLFVAAFQPEPQRRLTKITRIREAFSLIERGERLPGSLFLGDTPSLRPRSKSADNEPIAFDEQAVLKSIVNARGPATRASQESLGPDITLGPQLSIGPDDSLWPAAVEPERPKVRTPRKQPSSVPPAFRAGKSKILPLAFAIGLGASVVTAGMFVNWSEPETAPSAHEPSKGPAPLARIVQKASVKVSTDECLLSYFPGASFVNPPKLSFLCEKKDFPEGTGLLFALVRAHAERKAKENALPEALDAGTPDPRKADKPDAGVDPAVLAALPYQGELGWYDLAAASIMKRNCCAGSAQNLELPRTVGYCPQLSDVVQSLGDASTRPGDLSPQARRFDEAVTCLATTKTAHSLGYQGAPTPENRAAFQRFLTYAAVGDAKRAGMRR